MFEKFSRSMELRLPLRSRRHPTQNDLGSFVAYINIYKFSHEINLTNFL